MYCKVFTSKQAYHELSEINIACDKAMVTDGWICFYKNEQLVASFDMTTVYGWVMIDSTADTPQTEETCGRCVYARGSQWCQGCNGTPKMWDGEKIVDTPQTEQTDCAWK